MTREFQYDNSGNLLEDGRARYEYDAFNRNTKAETPDGNVQVNHYDAEGLRHEMEENGKLVSFIFRGREVVAEESQEDRIRYIRTGELLASGAEYARTYYHYASDEMGSITHVVAGDGEEDPVVTGQGGEPALAGESNGTADDSWEVLGGRILNHYEYDAWGNTTVCEEAVPNRFRFNGQQFDPVTQQYYLRARYYNPVIGRFTQEDTYRGDGLNLYAYCRNNPVSYVDPSGHAVISCESAQEHMRNAIAADQDITRMDPTIANQLRKWYENKKSHGWLSDDEVNLARQIGLDAGSKPDITTGYGYDAGDDPVRINGEWSINDMKQALLGHPPRGLGSPDVHHGGQMPGAALHEVDPNEHRNNSALHQNKYNQGVTPEMRESDRQLHWWYRAREQGADQLLPGWIYD